MQWSNKSKWIWINDNEKEDVYGDFAGQFEYCSGDVVLCITADSNYCVYINGEYALSGQYPDFPHYKVYDRVEITKYCKKGTNTVAIQVWHYGVSNLSYYKSEASLRFEVYNDSMLKLCSDENILCRKSTAFQNGLKQNISRQLGFSFCYDTTKDDNWQNGNLIGFEPCKIIKRDIALNMRKIKRVQIGSRAESRLIKKEDNYHLFDLGREEVGYLTLKIKSPQKQKLTIAFGEHIADGCVRQIIADRNFSVCVTVGEGVSEYTNYFRRLGLRYLEIRSETNIEVIYASVLPTTYPLTRILKKFDDPLCQKIYDTSVRTLELCMHDHYEDCPWREQAFYAMDSRNQMLCGYYAFNEYDFPRDNLILMSKDNRSDGLLSICVPTDRDMTIPSFSLHYFTQVYEYCCYSSDLTLAREVLPKLKSVMEVFLSRIENGLAKNFKNQNNWNFYEWTDGLDGYEDDKTDRFDCVLNCLLSIALTHLQKICDMIGEKVNFLDVRNEINNNIRAKFYNPKTKLYVNTLGKETYSELTNALAVLCGACNNEEAQHICDKLASDNNLTDVSLSMVCFKYDALIKTNESKYKDYIINNIMEKYKPMLDADASAFWETEKGESDFDNAGSLCHGWSAMPIYYFNKLL